MVASADPRATVTGMSPPHHFSADGAGQSAQREYERRRAARRRHAKARHGLMGSLYVNLTPEPFTTVAWQRGGDGELATARELAWRLRRSNVVVIHDRRIPGRGRANIDHIAIGAGGITVIDTKSSHGHVALGTAGIINRHEHLLVNGRDRTSQLTALQRQIDTITDRLQRSGIQAPSVLGALCYPYMSRRLLHNGRTRDGLITVDDARHVAKLANRSGGLTPDEIYQLAEAVAATFPPAA